MICGTFDRHLSLNHCTYLHQSLLIAIYFDGDYVGPFFIGRFQLLKEYYHFFCGS